MANKGIVHLFLSALSAALLSFFLLYFFSPSMSTQFLGVSFATRKGSDTALVQTAVDKAVNQVKNSPEFTKEATEKFLALLKSAEVQDKLKDAAKQGETVVNDVIKSVVDRVQ